MKNRTPPTQPESDAPADPPANGTLSASPTQGASPVSTSPTQTVPEKPSMSQTQPDSPVNSNKEAPPSGTTLESSTPPGHSPPAVPHTQTAPATTTGKSTPLVKPPPPPAGAKNDDNDDDEDPNIFTVGDTLHSNSASYLVIGLLGTGGFGAVYHTRNTKTNQEFAVKVERRLAKRKHTKLQMEVAILKAVSCLRNEKSHFLRIVDRARRDDCFFIVMTLVGKSLDQLKAKQPARVFSLGTGFAVAIQCLEACQDLHNCGFIHRDLKGGNLAIGLGANSKTVYLLDFGLARKFTGREGIKVPRKTVPFKGTVYFASVSCHLKKELGPKDDCESWLYVFMDFIQLRGLPWKKKKTIQEVLKCKIACRKELQSEMFCGLECRDELLSIMKYIDSLTYPEHVDYDFIYKSIKLAAEVSKVNINDPFDWEKKSSTSPSIKSI